VAQGWWPSGHGVAILSFAGNREQGAESGEGGGGRGERYPQLSTNNGILCMGNRSVFGLATRLASLSAVTTAFVGVMASEAGAQTLRNLDSEIFSEFKYRHIGPVGNRVSAVAGVPGDPNVYYIGAASGGVFKTTDGGVGWEPVFDDQPAASIGSIAIDPVNPNVVWVGTGETFIRSNVSIGNGIYKTTDGGKTWAHLGLERTGAGSAWIKIGNGARRPPSMPGSGSRPISVAS